MASEQQGILGNLIDGIDCVSKGCGFGNALLVINFHVNASDDPAT